MIPALFRYIFYILKHICSVRRQEVIIRNARKENVDFKKQGFILCKFSETENIREKIKSEIKNLYPSAKDIKLGGPGIIRGPGGRPYMATVHMDLNQHLNDFKKSVFDPYGKGWDGKSKVIVLGIWKPIEMKGAVENYGLALCDSSTITQEDIVDVDVQGAIPCGNISMSAGLVYNEKQKWFYFPKMKTNEILFFRHFEWDPNSHPYDQQISCVPHSTFYDPLCPPDVEKRKSIEYRSMIIF
jgi:hypothetical protein